MMGWIGSSPSTCSTPESTNPRGGARACPPEDVGGTPGFEEYLEAMADPDLERHDEFMGWRGPFDNCCGVMPRSKAARVKSAKNNRLMTLDGS